jgi:ribonuclease HI
MAETVDSSIPWHPAFVQAIALELEPWEDSLTIIPESTLTSEPLRIDVVIIKKDPKLVIDKNIARIFRGVNILEYKSPDDYFSVSDFYKVLSYAFLYAALNNVLPEDLTLSIVEARHPRELFRHIRERGGSITETAPGIYAIGGYPLAIQVIESGKLSFGENLWLRGLTKDLNPAVAGSILKESRRRGREAKLEAYLYALVTANLKAVQEVVAMSDEVLAFDQWVEEMGWAAKWEKSGWQKAEAQYQPVLAAKDRAIGEKDRENQELRRRLREAGIDP